MAEQYEYTVYNGDTPEVRSRTPRRRRRRGGRVVLKILVVLLLLLAACVGIWKLVIRPPTAADGSRDGCYTLLLAGTDGDGSRTDTIMLLYVDETAGEAGLLSLPRDTLVDLSMSVPKLNGVYGVSGGGEAGMEALMDQAELLLGYRPDSYVLVDFTAVEQIVDILGGVEFDVPVDMYYADPAQDLYINLDAGLQTLTGEQALWVLRYRSGYAMADLERVSVQRELLQAMASQYLKLSNVTKLPQLLEVYQERVLSDLSFGNLVYLAMALRKCDTGNMAQNTLPGEAVWYQGGSYYQVDLDAAVSLLNSSYNPLETAITAANLRVVNVVDGQLTVLGGATTASAQSTEQTADAVPASSAPVESSNATSVSPEPSASAPAAEPETSEIVPEQTQETPVSALPTPEQTLPSDELPTEDPAESEAAASAPPEASQDDAQTVEPSSEDAPESLPDSSEAAPEDSTAEQAPTAEESSELPASDQLPTE